MPLVNCPDCQTEMSDQARTCPKCGRPVPVSAERAGIALLFFIVGFAVIGVSLFVTGTDGTYLLLGGAACVGIGSGLMGVK